MTISEPTYKYPFVRKDSIVENFHGTEVADPYRWLEEPNSAETQEFIATQNALTNSWLERVAGLEKIKERLTEVWDFPRFSVAEKKGENYFFFKNDGLQNQAVLYSQETVESEAKVVIDPNTLSEDGTVALTSTFFSKDGTLLAYTTSASGSDWQEVRILNLETGALYDEVLNWCKFSSIAWKHDNSGFFYDRQPEPGTVPTEDENNYSRIYWHSLGTPQSQDALVYEDPKNKQLRFKAFITEDGNYLGLDVSIGTDTQNRFYYRALADDGPFIKLLDAADAMYSFVDNLGTSFYFQTDLNAPKGRILAIDITKPAPQNWLEIIPESPEPISFVATVADQLVIAYLKDVHHLIKFFKFDGTANGEIPLPTFGAISGLSGRREDQEMFLAFESFLYPPTVFRYDFSSSALTVLHAPEVKFKAEDFETTQVFYPSKDGTQVPMYLTHKKGLKLDGSNPTFLYAYGGFDISLLPAFWVSKLFWLEIGGVFAIPNLRGGGEYGQEWHKAGMLEKKQNVFDDFIGAAEWLIEKGYTSTAKLAINGRSNGGLLVAACMLQRPDLYGAVLCQVPVTDMLRFQKFTVGRFWTGELGNAEENAEHFDFMYKYSPLHNVKEDVEYPPIMITTAEVDDRVVPAHSLKFAATLQATASGQNPVLLWVETKAGHGLGKPTSKIIEELVETYAFLLKTLRVDYP